jgi:uncharacterized membrane protein (UPF0127 family)
MRNSLFLITLFLMTIVVTGCQASTQKICIRQACYASDVVDTGALRQRGLMFRDSLPAGTGMFFVFDQEEVYPFWMKNMKFPIDIIWIDAARRVVYVASSVPACASDPCAVYTPASKAKYVLEIPAGDAMKYGIAVGDQIQ